MPHKLLSFSYCSLNSSLPMSDVPCGFCYMLKVFIVCCFMSMLFHVNVALCVVPADVILLTVRTVVCRMFILSTTSIFF